MRAPGASGPYKGLSSEEWEKTGNPTPWEVVVLCTSSEDPLKAFEALGSTLDTHDALDLLDIHEMKDSWAHAARMNAQHE